MMLTDIFLVYATMDAAHDAKAASDVPIDLLGQLNDMHAHPDTATERQIRHLKRALNQHDGRSLVNVNNEKLEDEARLLRQNTGGPSSSSNPRRKKARIESKGKSKRSVSGVDAAGPSGVNTYKRISTRSKASKSGGGELGGLGLGLLDNDSEDDDKDSDYEVKKSEDEGEERDGVANRGSPLGSRGRGRGKEKVKRVRVRVRKRKPNPEGGEHASRGGRPRTTGAGDRNSYRNEPHKRKYKSLPPPRPLLLTQGEMGQFRGAHDPSLALVEASKRRRFLMLPCQRCPGCMESLGCLRMAASEAWRSADDSLQHFAEPSRAAQAPKAVRRNGGRSTEGTEGSEALGSPEEEDHRLRQDLGDQVSPSDPASLSLILQPWLHPNWPRGLSTHLHEEKLSLEHDKHIRLLSAGRSSKLTPGHKSNKISLQQQQEENGDEDGPSNLDPEKNVKSFDRERTVPKDLGLPVLAELSVMRARRHPSELLKAASLAHYKSSNGECDGEGKGYSGSEDEAIQDSEEGGGEEGAPSEGAGKGQSWQQRGTKLKVSRSELLGLKQNQGRFVQETKRCCQWCQGDGHVTRECPLWLLCMKKNIQQGTERETSRSAALTLPCWFQKLDPSLQEIMARVQEVSQRSQPSAPLGPEFLLAMSILAQEILKSEIRPDA